MSKREKTVEKLTNYIIKLQQYNVLVQKLTGKIARLEENSSYFFADFS
jgi:hypothetical protein